ncbi:MAG: 50S ribosomal protein L4 [bacterium]|nr:50S ribosomal protein L4 [bacterium]
MNYSGRKLRPQKRTGKPPIGSRSSTMLRGGAAAHGPVPRMTIRKMNVKARRLAVETLLTILTLGNRVKILPNGKMPDTLRTREYVQYLVDMNIPLRSKILYVYATKVVVAGMHNVPGHDVIPMAGLNCLSMLTRDIVMISDHAIVKDKDEGEF